ncbi:box A-binding factor [Stomoxys calcitrans]|uniref:box A-binding factor n=1 Tax=Stomoxys calcitrans TaxID=35570 RepID=UPI0027E28B6B|nr:box A-binding factor [Stomoxys calcitrans]
MENNESSNNCAMKSGAVESRRQAMTTTTTTTTNGRTVVIKNENRDERTASATAEQLSSCKKTCVLNEGMCGSHHLGGGVSNNTTSGNGNNSHKMGSRRIFTPQFKLQVLESYRNDNDCKGNQRATARKYNIHRRQIQKWLQCESSLRSSVANINQNTVKHQFHNISMHQQSQKSSIPSATAASLLSVSPYGANSQHGHLGLEAVRSEAPHSGAIIVPSLPSASSASVSSGVTTATTPSQGVFSAANLAAVVAAAAGAAMTITSQPSSNGSSMCPTDSVVPSPLRPTSIISASSNAVTAMSPLLHHHHHHHYGIPAYIHHHTPATVQLPVPILAHHISHPSQHIHQQAQQQQQQQQQHQPYQYHNLASYTQALTHQSSDKQQSSFLPSLSLPEVNVNALPPTAAASLTAATAAVNGFAIVVGESEHADSKTNSENMMESKEAANSGPKVSYPRHEYHQSTSLYQFKEDGVYSPLVYPLGPMDLSLRTRRNLKPDLPAAPKKDQEPAKMNMDSHTNNSSHSSIVDLTHRKRKGSSATCHNTDDNCTELSEKQLKLKDTNEEDNDHATNSHSDEDEVEIEVGTEEKLPPSKPVKLFKPYLLDTDADSENSTAVSSASTDMKYGESREASPWIRYTASLSPPPHCYDIATAHCQGGGGGGGATFQFSMKDNAFTMPSENANFPAEVKTSENMKSAFTSIPTISPTSFRSPKGSPSSSGYESSSSTYSDSSFSSRGESSYAYNRTYSLSLQMHSLHQEQINLQRSKHVERWLEQESRTPSEPNSPIAILA